MTQAKHDKRKGVRGVWHTNAKLDWVIVDFIRANADLPWDHPERFTQAELAKRFDVSTGTIAQVALGNTWKEENRPEDE